MQLGLKFDVVASRVKESLSGSDDLEGAIKTLALSKARDVADRVKEGLVIAADTVVLYRGEIFGKPKDPAEAKEMLRILSGEIHEVITGLAVINAETGKKAVECVKTRVKMRTLTEDEIEGYVATGEPSNKAGAYAIQGRGAALIESIDGCYYNVVGLPLSKLSEMLNKFEINVLTRIIK